MRKLLVIIPDRLSQIISKGEITPRYYNPGNLFDEVHILMINDDHPNPKQLQLTVGRAKLILYNLGEPDFLKTGFFSPWLMWIWASAGVRIAKDIKPDLIRCHGGWINSYLAKQIKIKLNIPYIVSMHTNPDDGYRDESSWWNRWFWIRMRQIEKIGLLNSNLVLPVYESIVPYLKNMGVNNYEVAYNVLGGSWLKRKTTYTLRSTVQIVTVGRLIPWKSPELIIRAIKPIEGVNLTIIGPGPLENELKKLTKKLGMDKRVSFWGPIPNKELCQKLAAFDIFAVYCRYKGISKTVLEASLIGMPIIVSNFKKGDVPELEGDWLLAVDHNEKAYRNSIHKLISDDVFRQKLGQNAYAYANRNWSPKFTERKYVEIYKRLIPSSF